MKFTYGGILYIHVATIKDLKLEIWRDKYRVQPCIIWYADGLPQGMPNHWSPSLDERMMAAHRGQA